MTSRHYSTRRRPTPALLSALSVACADDDATPLTVSHVCDPDDEDGLWDVTVTRDGADPSESECARIMALLSCAPTLERMWRAI